MLFLLDRSSHPASASLGSPPLEQYRTPASCTAKENERMKPELIVNVCQIIPRNSEDDVAWVFINVEDGIPDEKGLHARINIEIPLRLEACANQSLAESEAISKARALLSSAISDL